MNGLLQAALKGAGAGVIATIPMSAVMLAAGKAGLMGEQPPERITEAALGSLGQRHATKAEVHALSVAGHLAYGAATGAVFGVLQRRLHPPVPPVLHGIGFGLAVWVLSYQGWLPALGIMPPPEHDRPGRPASMIAAHVVFGATLGGLTAEFLDDERGGSN